MRKLHTFVDTLLDVYALRLLYALIKSTKYRSFEIQFYAISNFVIHYIIIYEMMNSRGGTQII